MGTSTVEFGTVGSWLVDVLNVLTGNLDRPGGAMFPQSPVGAAPRPPRPGRGFLAGRWHSRVSGFPEVLSELPATALSEETRDAGRGPGQGGASPSRATRCCPRPTETG